MILGFAHLGINSDSLAEAESAWQAQGYARTALHTDVPNHPSKQRFLTRYQPLHDLILMAGSSLWPLEVTRHGPTHLENTQIVWAGEAIQVIVPNPEPLRRLLIEGLGFSETANGILKLDGRFPNWSCRISVHAGVSRPTSLDAVGPTCLAFYCSHLAEDAKELIDLGATDFTGGFDIDLGKRSMTIAMLRAPGGPLLELINLRINHDHKNR